MYKDVKNRYLHELWDEFFATSPGKEYLHDLGRWRGLMIVSDNAQKRIRIYGGLEDRHCVGMTET
jgi:hypothetical protein